jgi:hypothetical protein
MINRTGRPWESTTCIRYQSNHPIVLITPLDQIVGAVGGGAIANGINPGATSGWSPASWLSQRYQSGLGSIGQWLGTGPTAASGGVTVPATNACTPAISPTFRAV